MRAVELGSWRMKIGVTMASMMRANMTVPYSRRVKTLSCTLGKMKKSSTPHKTWKSPKTRLM